MYAIQSIPHILILGLRYFDITHLNFARVHLVLKINTGTSNYAPTALNQQIVRWLPPLIWCNTWPHITLGSHTRLVVLLQYVSNDPSPKSDSGSEVPVSRGYFDYSTTLYMPLD